MKRRKSLIKKKEVKAAEHNLEVAKEDLRMKRIEVDKLKSHKEDWMKEARLEQRKVEEKEMNEIGNVIYTLQQREKKTNNT